MNTPITDEVLLRKRDKHWTFRNDRIRFYDVYDNIFVDHELVSSQGAHFHFWLEQKQTAADLRNAIEECRNNRDMVSWSWDYIPESKILVS